MSAVNEASPGFLIGFASLPVSTTRWADTTGNLCCSTRSTDSPLASLKLLGTGNLSWEAGPELGVFLRQGSSGMVLATVLGSFDSASCSALARGGSSMTFLPGAPYTTTLAPVFN